MPRSARSTLGSLTEGFDIEAQLNISLHPGVEPETLALSGANGVHWHSRDLRARTSKAARDLVICSSLACTLP